MMSEQKKTPEQLPAFIKAAPELLPVWDWWVKDGKSTVITLAVAGLVVAGYFGVKSHLASRDAKAAQAVWSDESQAVNEALMPPSQDDSASLAELESAVTESGSSKASILLKLRLAKRLYDAGKYDRAYALYDALTHVKSEGAFEDLAWVGRAFSLEGQQKFAEAQKAFADYAQAHTNSYLLLDAQLGAIRCEALTGAREKAARAFTALANGTTNTLMKARITRMAQHVQNYDPKKPLVIAPAELAPIQAPALPASATATATVTSTLPGKVTQKAPLPAPKATK